MEPDLVTNRCTLEQLRQMTAEQAKDLPVDQLASLLEDVADRKADLKHLDDILYGAMALRFGEIAAHLRTQAGKMTGTVSIPEGDFVVKADLPAKIDWNQDKLREAEAVVRSWNEDPAQYMTAVLSVPESRFKAWPDTIKAVFSPARTVGTGKPSFKIERAKRRAAA